MPDNMHDEHTIHGSDVTVGITLEHSPIPNIQDPKNPWLPKTDWSRDGIIASDD